MALKLNKHQVNFRFTAETIRRLAAAAREAGITKNLYVELALRKQFAERELVFVPNKSKTAKE